MKQDMLCTLSVRTAFLHSSHVSLGSRSTNFLPISSDHAGSAICITPTLSFVETSSFSRLCTFSFMFENLWSISFWVKLRLSLSYPTSVFTKVRLSHSWSSLCFSNAWCPDITFHTNISCFENILSCLVLYSCNISLKIFLLYLIVTIFSM